ncbi:hypothetical protein GCM10011352_09340 [Marinobacterium zhoushanense]|uniref:TRAP transporter small permease protein n=1 Tax=Marinobacterium zhoushanense TaxID=1679163 RepID=A0ABQ1K404_9GAMM|nr:TRAP transporter small permease [Marinobacterium zhoushanense]GGB85626.1 hypothetical protein GCM10011352_09340 [Marinobacterium zhoushanense]
MRLLTLLDRIVATVAGSALAISTTMLLLNVANRYIIQGWLREWAQDGVMTGVYQFLSGYISPLSAMADEVPGLLLVWIAYLGAYLAMRDKGHINFEMLVEKLPESLARWVTRINAGMIVAFLGVLLYQSVRMIMVDGETEIETAEVAQGWFMAVLPIFSVLMMIAIVDKIIRGRNL